MNNNKKLSKKVKHVLPLALAAALTVSGTGITASAQTFNHRFVRQISVVADVSANVTLNSTKNIIKIVSDGYYLTNNESDFGAKQNTPGAGYVITTEGTLSNAKIIVDTGANNENITLLNFHSTDSTGSVIDLPDADVSITLAGNNSISAGLVGKSNAGSGKLTLKGDGKLVLGSTVEMAETIVEGGTVIADSVKGKLTIKDNTVVAYNTVTGDVTAPATGLVYAKGVGTLYGDPDVKAPDELKNAKVGANLADGDITVENVEYTGKPAEIKATVKIAAKKFFDNKEKVFEKDKDYKVAFKNPNSDNTGIGAKELTFTAIEGSGLIFPAGLNKSVTVTAKSLKKAVVTLDKNSFEYTGKENKVVPTVTLDGVVLKPADYDVTEAGEKVVKATKAGKYTVEIKGKGNYSNADAVTATWEIKKKNLTIGSAKIEAVDYSGNKAIDPTKATVTLNGVVEGETLAKNTDYTLTGEYDTADVGKNKLVTIKVTPTSNSKFDNYTINPGQIRIGTGEIKKITQVKPSNAPTVKDTHKISKNNPNTFMVELNAVAGQEYRMDKGKWQKSPVFDGITAGKHKFEARVAAAGGNDPSDVSPELEHNFTKLPNTKKIALNYTIVNSSKEGKKKVIIDKVPGALYKFGNAASDEYSTNNIKDELDSTNSNYSISIRYAATPTQEAGAEESKVIDLSKTTLSIAAPKLDIEVKAGSDDNKMDYIISTPKAELPTGYKYQYGIDNQWKDANNDNGFKNLELNKDHIFAIRINDGHDNLSPVTSKEVVISKIKTPMPKLVYSITRGTHTGKKIVINEQTVKTDIAGTVEYKIGTGNWGTAEANRVIDDYTGTSILIGTKFQVTNNNGHYDEVENVKTISLSGNKGVVGTGETVVKPDEPKKDDPKKDNTKKPDETKKPDDTKKPDNNTTKPANVDKAIKDAFKKSTKSGNVSLTGIGSALKKAVGENAASLSVNLKTSKTKATAASVTKKLKGSKLVSKTVYSLNVKSGATNLTDKQVSGSKIKVTLKVSLGNKNRTVYVMDVSTGKRVKAKYNAKTKKITFTTANVGDFVIVNKAK